MNTTAANRKKHLNICRFKAKTRNLWEGFEMSLLSPNKRNNFVQRPTTHTNNAPTFVEKYQLFLVYLSMISLLKLVPFKEHIQLYSISQGLKMNQRTTN